MLVLVLGSDGVDEVGVSSVVVSNKRGRLKIRNNISNSLLPDSRILIFDVISDKFQTPIAPLVSDGLLGTCIHTRMLAELLPFQNKKKNQNGKKKEYSTV